MNPRVRGQVTDHGHHQQLIKRKLQEEGDKGRGQGHQRGGEGQEHQKGR